MGIGKILITEAEKWAAELNVYMIVLTSGLRDERKDAYAFISASAIRLNHRGL